MSDPDNHEDRRLDEFARRLTESLPELPEEAMQRVEQVMRGEVRRVRRRRMLKLTSIAALAASLLVAAGILAIRHGAGPGQRSEIEIALPEEQSEIPPVVEDRFVAAQRCCDGEEARDHHE